MIEPFIEFFYNMKEVFWYTVQYVILIIWVYWPVYVANGGGLIVGRYLDKKGLNRPIDGNKLWKDGRRILGDGKTWGGLVGGICFATVSAFIQILIAPYVIILTLKTYNEFPEAYFLFYCRNLREFVARGTLGGTGGLLGDITKSFFKRRHNLKRGAKFIPWDQIDSIIGGTLFMLPFLPLGLYTFLVIVGAFIVTPAVMLTGNRIAYKLGIKDVPH